MAQTIATTQARVHGNRLGMLRQGMSAWLLLLPAVVFFLGYQVWPIVRVIWLSLTDYKFLSNDPTQWVGSFDRNL